MKNNTTLASPPTTQTASPLTSFRFLSLFRVLAELFCLTLFLTLIFNLDHVVPSLALTQALPTASPQAPPQQINPIISSPIHPPSTSRWLQDMRPTLESQVGLFSPDSEKKPLFQSRTIWLLVANQMEERYTALETQETKSILGMRPVIESQKELFSGVVVDERWPLLAHLPEEAHPTLESQEALFY